MPEPGTKIDENGRVCPDLRLIGNKIYQGGAAVAEWQLEPQELKEVWPERYKQVYGDEPQNCPVAGCDKTDLVSKQAFIVHCRHKHPALLADKKALFDAAADIVALCTALKGE